MYKFVKVQTHPKCPNVVGWWLLADPRDLRLEGELHEAVAHRNFKLLENPHDPSDKWQNPIYRTAAWMSGKMAIGMKAIGMGVPLLVNAVGGMCFLTPDMPVLDTFETNQLAWPEMAPSPFERIKISRYADGTHYWLTSSTGRIFSPHKHNTLADARKYALLYVREDKITVDAPPRQRAEGD